MRDDYYLDKLYPLQDEVLSLPALKNSIFYLTGGTALGRHYLNHRYSDDLDFFTNVQLDFQKNTEDVLKALQNKFEVEINSISQSYVLLSIHKSNVFLKIEFVKDVPYRNESPISTLLFIRTDHWNNILSNKISALSREAAKDVADIIMLCKKFNFRWSDVIYQANMKDIWVNELEVSRRIAEFPPEELRMIKWIDQPEISDLVICLKKISAEILTGTENSLTRATNT